MVLGNVVLKGAWNCNSEGQTTIPKIHLGKPCALKVPFMYGMDVTVTEHCTFYSIFTFRDFTTDCLYIVKAIFAAIWTRNLLFYLIDAARDCQELYLLLFHIAFQSQNLKLKQILVWVSPQIKLSPTRADGLRISTAYLTFAKSIACANKQQPITLLPLQAN